MPKPLTVWLTTNWKFLKRNGNTLPGRGKSALPASWEICMQVKKQQLEPDMEQQTGSKLGKEYVQAIYCHPAYLTYMQSTSFKMPGWMKHKLESRCSWHHLYGRKWRRTKKPLDERERGEWKSCLKTQHFRKLRSWHLVMANRWGISDRLYFSGLPNHCRWWLQPWN